MRAVHFLPEGYDLWPGCGTSHDLLVTDEPEQVTCFGCIRSGKFGEANRRLQHERLAALYESKQELGRARAKRKMARLTA